ncbi:BtpA/SgcQ family protein [Vagococcus elongatus]|uniref:SgcQ protein n=1 Tax=Vagococcus elongatus TaxID=180344 RepID=A0A430APC1_9ENTE|nr:BtpA/SgcQ family protein [Vagococcus elongatus]RSU09972.1 SgcQ protein [Vagococcus elongatus]
MLWIDDMFKKKKPIISMLHLDALPGDPRFKFHHSVKEIVKHARKDLHALQDGGVDGIIFSNEFSLPYQRKMSFVTPSCMARVIGELMKEIKVPFGVDCISDGQATIELAAAVNADFVRGTFSGVYVGDGGFYNNDFSELLRRKAALYLDDLKMLYFINPESDQNMDSRSLSEIAQSTIFKAHPDGLCISANAAGQDVDDELILEVKQSAPEVVVICNTGCRPETIAKKLKTADAAIVGTFFKENGFLENERLENVRVDQKRVEEFMEVVYDFRKNLRE